MGRARTDSTMQASAHQQFRSCVRILLFGSISYYNVTSAHPKTDECAESRDFTTVMLDVREKRRSYGGADVPRRVPHRRPVRNSC
jgi:hypothetical protein